MRILFLALFVFGLQLYGITLNEIIQKALNGNLSLKSIKQRIEANQFNIDASNQFSNPVISYVENNIDTNQAMSSKKITLQQKIPYFGKRESLKKVAQEEETLLIKNLQQAKVSLINEIKNQAYSIWKLEMLYKIIRDYENLTVQNIELSKSYTTTSTNQHMGIVSADLTLSNLRIEKNTLNAQIDMAYAKLSYLTSFKVKNLEVNLSITTMPTAISLQRGLKNNDAIAIKEQEIQKNKALVDVTKLNNYPDMNLIGAYSKRSNFDDFWTVGMSISLPIYGTEDYREQEAKTLLLSAKSLKKDVKVAVESEFQRAYLQMKSAYDIYQIIHEEALPQVEHMFELTNSSISTGGDLFKYIDILVQKLKLEQKSISAIENYNRAKAKILALSGELK